MSEHDLVIRNGIVVDGTGRDGIKADVAIDGDRITAVGKVEGRGKRELDAAGKIVTPGFVDIHTHYDGQAIWSNRLNPSSSHGVTTVVTGNCGVGFAPCRNDDHELLIRVMEGVEDIPGVVMTEGLQWSWETFPQFLDAVESRPHDIDVGMYLPHSPLRVYVMGERGANREKATDEDLAKMKELTKEAIKAGALGFATSRVFVHKTSDGKAIPSYQADYSEFQAIADGMTEAGSGIIQLVPEAAMEGWPKELKPLIEIGRKSGRPITFTLGMGNTSQGPKWQEALSTINAANDDGVTIKAQVFPRPIGMILGLRVSAHPFCLCPTYLAMKDRPLEERVAEMRKPEVRAKLLSEEPVEGHPLAHMAKNFDWMYQMLDAPNYEPAADKNIASLAKARGVSPLELAYDMLLENDGHALLWTALGNYPGNTLDPIHTLLTDDDVIVGLGDGGAHYGMICDSSYPTFLMSYWARDRKGMQMTLPHAVKMLTQEPAKMVGLLDRGILAPGYKADVNIIDHEKLTLHGPEIRTDLPAGGRRLDQKATGYVATIVSGQVISENGQPTGALPGRLVRGEKQAPAQALSAAE